MKVKIFSAPNIIVLDKEINDWLYVFPTMKIIHVLQSESETKDSTWALNITIFYEEE